MSQRSMVPVVIMGTFVLAGGIVLFLMMRSGDDAAAQPTNEPVTATERAPAPAARPGTEPTVTPSLPAETPPPETGPVKEYMVGDRKVRDHRTGYHPPVDLPPSVHPAESRRIDSAVTHEVGQKLKVIVKDCAKTLPAGARGKDSHLEGQIVIAIKAKQVTVTKAIVHLRDVTDPAVETIKQCIEEKALTVTNTTAESDLESYDINVSYAL